MDTLERMDLYKKLCDLGGVSGHEKSVRKFMKEEISKYTDTIVSDNLGSVLGYLDGDGPTIMISGHMDEVGAMVVDITNGGFLKMIAIGGINPEVMVSQNVIVHSKNGDEIRGVVGAIPPHIGGSQTSFDDLQVDIGASSRDEVLSWGINVGCQITFSNNFYVDKLTLGRDFLVDSSLVTDLMSGAFDSNSIISFDKANNSLLIKKEIMTTMLSSAGADGGAKMEVERLASIANGIKAYIAYNDSELEATVASVVSAAETALANDFVDETQFNTEDEDQQEAVSTLMEELSTVSEILSDPEQELTEENTDALVEAINNLSEENQQALYEQFASEIGEDELRRLYEQMFGGGN